MMKNFNEFGPRRFRPDYPTLPNTKGLSKERAAMVVKEWRDRVWAEWTRHMAYRKRPHPSVPMPAGKKK